MNSQQKSIDDTEGHLSTLVLRIPNPEQDAVTIYLDENISRLTPIGDVWSEGIVLYPAIGEGNEITLTFVASTDFRIERNRNLTKPVKNELISLNKPDLDIQQERLSAMSLAELNDLVLVAKEYEAKLHERNRYAKKRLGELRNIGANHPRHRQNPRHNILAQETLATKSELESLDLKLRRLNNAVDVKKFELR